MRFCSSTPPEPLQPVELSPTGNSGYRASKLNRRSGGGVLAGLQAGERVGDGAGEVGLVGVARAQRAQVLARDAVELGVVNRKMDGVVADVDHFQHHVLGEALLEAEVPTQRVRALHDGIEEGDALAGEGQQAERVARGLEEAGGERVAQRGQRRQVVVAGGGERRGLAEALLVGIGVGGVLVVDAHGRDGDGRHEHPEAAADDRLAVEEVGRPGHPEARAHQVRVDSGRPPSGRRPGRSSRRAH